jgi:hypothetical protein
MSSSSKKTTWNSLGSSNSDGKWIQLQASRELHSFKMNQSFFDYFLKFNEFMFSHELISCKLVIHSAEYEITGGGRGIKSMVEATLIRLERKHGRLSGVHLVSYLILY